jgi:hypothetical protein
LPIPRPQAAGPRRRGASAAALLYLALAGTPTAIMLVVWFAAFGFFAALGLLLIAQGKALFPPHQVGAASRSSTWTPRAACSWSKPSADF